MPYCMYLRKSRADYDAELRGEGETLARHEKTLLELSKKLNLNITNIYKEIVSGETIAARPVVQQVLTEVEQGLWEGVLVMEVERLARGDTIDQGIMAQAFKYSNTKIVTPIKIYDPNNEFDEEYFEFGLFMSRREYKTINRRIQRGRTASAKEGKFILSTPPYGYDKVKIVNDKGFTLKPNAQANVVKMIFELYTHGELQEDGSYKKLGSHLISKKLDSMQIKPMLKDSWSVSSIRDMLKNPVYIGKIRWSYKKEIKKVVNGVIKKERSLSSEYLLVDGLHEAIIDEETFKKAQTIMNNRIYAPVPDGRVLRNPLSGILYCGKCGKTMTRLAAQGHTPYDTIKCSNTYCDNISAPLYVVENKILDYLREWLDTYKLNIQNNDTKNENMSLTVKKNQIKSLEDELATLKKQQAKLYDLLEQGIYSTDLFLERNMALTSKIDTITCSIETLTKSYDQELRKEKISTSIIPAIENVLDVYYNLSSPAAKNELLKLVLKRVEYTKTERNKKGFRENDNFEIIVHPLIPE